MLAALLFLLILVVDQCTKFVIQMEMIPGQSWEVFPPFFSLTYVLNPGAAFGILEHQRFFFVFACIVLLLLFLYFYPKLRRMSPSIHYGCVAMLAGAVGNMLDRIHTGLVIDFFDFHFWPVFNVADIAIVIGVFLMACAILFGKDEEK